MSEADLNRVRTRFDTQADSDLESRKYQDYYCYSTRANAKSAGHRFAYIMTQAAITEKAAAVL